MTISRLRSDIGAGRTGDKPPAGDHAPAPAGPNEDAAVTPIDPTVDRSERATPGFWLLCAAIALGLILPTVVWLMS